MCFGKSIEIGMFEFVLKVVDTFLKYKHTKNQAIFSPVAACQRSYHSTLSN